MLIILKCFVFTYIKGESTTPTQKQVKMSFRWVLDFQQSATILQRIFFRNFLSILSLATLCLAVDHETFRTCSQVDFCRYDDTILKAENFNSIVLTVVCGIRMLQATFKLTPVVFLQESALLVHFQWITAPTKLYGYLFRLLKEIYFELILKKLTILDILFHMFQMAYLLLPSK